MTAVLRGNLRAIERFGSLLQRGAVLVDERDPARYPTRCRYSGQCSGRCRSSRHHGFCQYQEATSAMVRPTAAPSPSWRPR
jgi:hypothetical protein